MELECLKQNLNNLISLAEKGTSKNVNLPILQTILLEAKGNNLIIRSTNLDIGLEFKLNTKITKDGLVAVDAKNLLNLLNNLNKEEKVVLKSDQGNLIIKTPKTQTTLKGFTVDDFPIIPKPEGEKNVLNSEILVEGIKSVAYAGSISSIKPEIASVYIYHDGQNCVFVSTDSFRLAEKKFEVKDLNDFPPIIIPLKNSLEISRVFELGSSIITVQNNQNQLFLTADNTYLTSQVVSGVYPDYQQIMPNNFKTKIEVNKEDLVSALKTSNIFADRFNQVLVSFNKDSLVINAKNQDSGENSSTITAHTEGDELEVVLNAKYILDGLQSINTQKVFLGCNEKNRPILMKGVGDESFRYLIMPVTR
jgi:DNA polymerase-3 subunit beta